MEARGFVHNPKDISTSRVLVVDPLDETREVLEIVLARRGVRIVSAAHREEGLRLAREFHPDVVVLDGELPPPDGASGTEGECHAENVGQSFESTTPENPPSMILLGDARRREFAGAARYMQKPYLYGRLVHTIEELLAARRAA